MPCRLGKQKVLRQIHQLALLFTFNNVNLLDETTFCMWDWYDQFRSRNVFFKLWEDTDQFWQMTRERENTNTKNRTQDRLSMKQLAIHSCISTGWWDRDWGLLHVSRLTSERKIVSCKQNKRQKTLLKIYRLFHKPLQGCLKGLFTKRWYSSIWRKTKLVHSYNLLPSTE